MMWEEELAGFFCLSSTRRPSWCGVAVAAICGRKIGTSRYHMGMSYFRKKPVIVEAMQYLGSNIEAIWDWAGADVVYGPVEDDRSAYVFTAEGKMEASVGDWIIKGVKGEFYPCKPDIFEMTYESLAE